MAALDNLGNGAGYLYITDSTGTNIITNLQNTALNARTILFEALTAAPLSGEVLAQASYTPTVVSGTGSVTSITINGVQVLSSTVTGTTPALVNSNLAANITAYGITSGYTAYVSGSSLIFVPATGTGSTPNGYVVTVTSTNITATNTNMSGGAGTSGVYSTGFNGRRFFLWADPVNAVPSSLSGAQEISSLIIQRGIQSGNVVVGSTPISANSAGSLVVPRTSNFQIVSADTASSASSGTMTTISTAGFVDGDMLQIRGTSAARVVTITSGSTSGAILLSGGTSFSSGNAATSITVEYVGALGYFVEVGRTPGIANVTTSALRSQGLPWAVPGTTATAITASGGTITLSPGSSTGVQYLSGTVTLTSSLTVTGGGTPIDGDVFWIIYRAICTTSNSSTVTIFGKTLTTTQMGSGAIVVRATYVSANTAYDAIVYDDFSSVDYATAAVVATKEPSLGNPSTSGYILSSTTVGVRSWVQNNASILTEVVGYSVPTTGGASSYGAGITQAILNPAGTLASYTINLPQNPVNGARFAIACSQIITSCTVQTLDGSTLLGQPTTSGTNWSIGWVYCSTSSVNTWFRVH